MMSAVSEQSTPTPSSGGRFSRLISEILLRKRRRQSIIEVDRNHKQYMLTSCMQEGLSWVPEAVMDVEKDDLEPEDFKEVIEAKFTNEVKEPYLFKSYAPKVFLCMRRNLDISEDNYQESLNPTDTTKPDQKDFLKFFSNSKGGQQFFLCNNKRYMIKTEKKSDVRTFLKILPKYFNHLEKYPHSLIVRYLGLHYIKIKGEKGRFFTVMQSVFHPDERITTRYDLKGCQANRFQEPDGQTDINVLKDNNLGAQTVKLGPLRDWFCHQTQIDCAFLEELGVMDYSLLLGEHTLYPSEANQNPNMAEVVLRVSKSLKHTSQHQSVPNNLPSDTSHISDTECHRTDSKTSNALDRSRIHPNDQLSEETNAEQSEPSDNVRTTPTNHQHKPVSPGFPVSENGHVHMYDNTYRDLDGSIIPGVINSHSHSTSSLINQSDQSSIAHRQNHLNELQVQNSSCLQEDLALESISDSMSYTSCGQQVSAQNLRYLPNVDNNAWHVIDGPTHRYYVGIIDLFTVYSVRKKCEHILKTVRYPKLSFSTVNPSRYSKRLQQFIVEHCE